MNRILLVLFVIMVLAGGGWYELSSKTTPAAPTTTTTPVATATDTTTTLPVDTTPATTTVQAPSPIIGANLALGTDVSKKYGTYLIGYTGMTVYTYAPDTSSVSTCTGTCAEKWPPYIVSSADNINQLQAGVKGKVGTTTRTDGTLQLTYKGHPLYFYSGDKNGSDTTGQGFGGVWYIVKP